MASKPSDSSGLELLESEVQPLRIIKRSKTVACCSPTRKNVGRRRRASGSTDTSIGSPPLVFDGPLTIRKKRQGRSSVLTDSLHHNEMDVGSSQAFVQDDPDVTPKANRGVSRTISAGAFLKSELHQQSSEIDATRYSVRGDRSRIVKQRGQYDALGSTSPKRVSPVIPERRPSKSKNFLLRALAGQNNKDAKPEVKSIRLVESTESRNTLVRKLSRRKQSQSSSSQEKHSSSASSTAGTYFIENASLDISDVEIRSRMSSSYSGSRPVSPSPSSSANSRIVSQSDNVFVLSPQIIITPEVSSVDTGSCFLWVAIEIRGDLRKADGIMSENESPLRSSDSSTVLFDLRRYGRLHAIRINLDLGPSCVLSEVFGDLHEPKIIRAGEAELVLVKIHFSTTAPRRRVREASSDDLMTELQHDLGETLAKYLTVRMTYKHSGFPSYRDLAMNAEGTTSHTTRLFTEASTTIRRHNSQSAWSPRTSQTLNTPLSPNPLIPLIERLLPAEEARDAIRKISAERPAMLLATRYPNIDDSSEETVKPGKPNITLRVDSAIAASLISPATIAGPVGPFPRLPSVHVPPGRQAEDEIDPARKIWTEMRRHSRGGQRHARSSISADHYFEQKNSPSRLSSGQSSIDTIQSAKTDIDQERNRIMEFALKNKRSMGAETLRSIAPSISHLSSKGSARQQKTGALSGLGLGTGRSWWGPPWW